MSEIQHQHDAQEEPRNMEIQKEPVSVPTRERVPHTPNVETRLGQKLQNVSLAIDAMQYVPTPIQEQVINGLLEKAGIPSGNFTYSLNLRNKLMEHCKTLTADIARYETMSDKEEREQQLHVIFDRTEVYIENLIQQFVLDNADANDGEDLRTTYQTKRNERIHDTYKLDLLATQMQISAAVVKGDDITALKVAEGYIREKYMGIKADMPLSEKMQEMIRGFSENLVVQTQQHVVPLLETNIRAFAKKSFIRSFGDRAKQTGSFALDWVSVPFSKSANDRMTRSMTPLMSLGPTNALSKTIPIVCDFAKTAYNVSINHHEALALLSATAGAITFDVALTAATWGVGAAVKGAHLTGNAAAVGGTAVKSLAALSAGFAVGKTTLRPLYGISNKLSFAQMEERIHERVLKEAKED